MGKNSRTFSGPLDQMCLPRVKIANYMYMGRENLFAELIMGTHDKPIRKIEYCAAVNAIITGGWDAAVKLWDPRTPTCVGTYLQPDVILALSVCGDKFVVGTAKRKVCIWDLRNMAGMLQRRESSLKYQTRCIKGFPNEQVCCRISSKFIRLFLHE